LEPQNKPQTNFYTDYKKSDSHDRLVGDVRSYINGSMDVLAKHGSARGTSVDSARK
jgi:hypothetical protein